MTLCWVLFMLLTVSAGELLSSEPAFATAETINGILGQTVLLPCNCSGINLDEDFVWQRRKTHEKIQQMFKYNKSNPSGFVPEDNCSLTLTNITAMDQGIYTCRFHVETYKQYFVILNVSQPASGENFTGKPDSASSKKGENFAGKKELWVPLLITILLALGLALFLYYLKRNSKHTEENKSDHGEHLAEYKRLQ